MGADRTSNIKGQIQSNYGPIQSVSESVNPETVRDIPKTAQRQFRDSPGTKTNQFVFFWRGRRRTTTRVRRRGRLIKKYNYPMQSGEWRGNDQNLGIFLFAVPYCAV